MEKGKKNCKNSPRVCFWMRSDWVGPWVREMEGKWNNLLASGGLGLIFLFLAYLSYFLGETITNIVSIVFSYFGPEARNSFSSRWAGSQFKA